MARMMVDVVVPDLPFERGDEVVVLVSGLGATPVMELYILYDEVERLLESHGLVVHRPYVGNYFTSLDMAGATLTLLRLDAELEELIDMEADCMGLSQFGR
jgi:dihydroxyacetone kinase-like protein